MKTTLTLRPAVLAVSLLIAAPLGYASLYLPSAPAPAAETLVAAPDPVALAAPELVLPEVGAFTAIVAPGAPAEPVLAPLENSLGPDARREGILALARLTADPTPTEAAAEARLDLEPLPAHISGLPEAGATAACGVGFLLLVSVARWRRSSSALGVALA